MDTIIRKATPRSAVIELIKHYLRAPESSWSNGVSGAIAEFMYDEDETVELRETDECLSAVTDRGAISIKLPAQITCFAYEQLTHCTRSWTQTVALALPQTQAGVKINRVITDMGVDKDAVNDQDREERLFDLGLGLEPIRFCVRTKEGRLIEKLTSLSGQVMLDQGRDVLELLQSSSPARIVISKLGRIEVYTPIPTKGAGTERGPHTHLLPKLLSKKELVIPDGYSATFHIYPPHPLHDKYGAENPFDRLRHEDFQDVLKKTGIEDYLKEKAAVAAKGSRSEDAEGRSTWHNIARQVVKMQSPYNEANQPVAIDAI